MNYEQKSGPIFCIPEKNDFMPTFWKFFDHTGGLDFAISTNVSGNVSSERLVSDSPRLTHNPEKFGLPLQLSPRILDLAHVYG